MILTYEWEGCGPNDTEQSIPKLSNFNKFTPQFSDLPTPPRTIELISSLDIHKFKL